MRGPGINQSDRRDAEPVGRFVRRVDLASEFAQWIDAQDAPRFLLVLGPPGSGKTAWAQDLARDPDTFVAASHFCRASDLETRSPLQFLERVCAQLAHHSPSFGAALLAASKRRAGVSVDVEINIGDACGTRVTGVHINEVHIHADRIEDLVGDMLAGPLRAIEHDISVPWVVIVDALDEAERYGGDVTIPKLLRGLGDLPRSIRFVLTTRPDADLVRQFARSGLKTVDLSLSAGARKAVRTYAETVLSEPPLSDRITPGALEATSTALAEKAGTNFLVARCAVAAVSAGRSALTPETFSAMPGDLPGLYLEILDQSLKGGIASWRERYAPIAGLLAVADEPLTERQIAGATDVKPSEIRTRCGELQQFLELQTMPDGLPRWAIFHLSFAEFLLDERVAGPYWCPAEEAHASFANWAFRAGMSGIDWRAVDPYLQRHLIYHLLSAGPGGDLRAKLVAVLDWGFLAARLATWNDAGHLGADLRAVSEVLEQSRTDCRSTLWPLRVRAALMRSALRSRIAMDMGRKEAGVADVLFRARELPPRDALKLLLGVLRVSDDEAGSARRQLADAAAGAARAVGSVSALLRVSRVVPISMQAGLVGEALDRASKVGELGPRVLDMLRVAEVAPSLRDSIEFQAVELIDTAAADYPDQAYIAILATFCFWSEPQRVKLLQRIVVLLPLLGDAFAYGNDVALDLVATGYSLHAVADAMLADLARRAESKRGQFAFDQLFWLERRLLPLLAMLASPEQLACLPVITAAFQSSPNVRSTLLHCLAAADFNRILAPVWRDVLTRVAAEENELARRSGLVDIATVLPEEHLESAFEIARSIGSESDEDRIDAELALLTRLPRGEHPHFATDRLASSKSFASPHMHRVRAMLEAIATDAPPPESWLAPGPQLYRAWHAKTSGGYYSKSDLLPLNGDAIRRELLQFAADAAASRRAQRDAESQEPANDTSDRPLRPKHPSDSPSPFDRLNASAFDAVMALAYWVPETGGAHVREVARGLAGTASTSDERWERSVAVLRLDPADAKSRDVLRTLYAEIAACGANHYDPCEQGHGTGPSHPISDTLALYAAELRLLTGEDRFESVSLTHAAAMDVADVSGGTGTQLGSLTTRAAVFISLAAASIFYGDRRDDLLLRAVQDSLVRDKYLDQVFKCGAKLLGNGAFPAAIALTTGRYHPRGRATFLTHLIPRLDEANLLAASAAAETLEEHRGQVEHEIRQCLSCHQGHQRSGSTRLGGVSLHSELSREESLYQLSVALDALSGKAFGHDRIASLRRSLQTLLFRVRQTDRSRGGYQSREQEDELVPLCDPTRIVLAPQFLSELTQVAQLLGQVFGDELVTLARDIAEAERFAAAV
jgi:hypothetical protein